MENPVAGDSSAAAGKGTAADDSGTSAAAAAGSARTGTPGWAGQSPDDASRLARAALQGTPLFTGSAAGGTGPAQQGDASGAAGGLLDPMQAAQQLTSDQLAAMLSTGGYTATALGSLGTAGLQAADNAAALNALLLGGGLNLNHLAASNLQLAGLGADLTALGALVGADPSELDDHPGGAGSKSAGGLGVTNNKQLSSRFRGVCWNKKNKRWQAAINSSGKYLYLGSFTNEDEAAHHFDRAAIKLRGKKAKLNFEYADYVDENGELLDDIILPQGATGGKDDVSRGGSAGGGAGRRGSKSAAAAAAAAAADASGLAGFGLDADFVNQAALAALMQQGAWQSMPRASRTSVSAAPLPLEKEQVSVLLPPGCALEYLLSVQQDGAAGDGGATSSGGGAGGSSGSKSLFGVVYREGGSGLWGAGVWTGYMFKAFGLYSTEGEAAQTARCAGELLSEDRDLRVSGGVANQQGIGLMAAATPAGLLTGPTAAAAAAAAAAAYPQDALALAGLAAGLGGGGSGAAARGVAGGVGTNGLLGVGPGGLVGAAGIGGLANVSLAQAAQLAQQAAAEQGLPMSYPPLSVALPAVTSALQLLPGGGAAGAGAEAAAAGGLDVAAAAAKACSEAEMQQLMQQLMQHQQQQLPGVAQQQQLGAGGDGLLKLANLDMSHLRQQLMEQQGAGTEADLQPQQQAAQGGEGVLGSIPGLDTGVGEKRGLGEGSEGADAAAAAVGGDAGGEHAPKRIKLEGAPADAARAGAAVPGGLMAAGGGGGDMAQIDLQDALKMLRSVQQQQQQQAQAPAQE